MFHSFRKLCKLLKLQCKSTASGLESAMNGAGSTVKGSTGKMSGALKGVGLAVAGAFAVDKIIGFGVAMVNATAEAQAMEAQFDSVFGELGGQATEVIRWSR